MYEFINVIKSVYTKKSQKNTDVKKTYLNSSLASNIEYIRRSFHNAADRTCRSG